MGEAGNWPAGVKVVSEWFPAEERALAAGIFNTGSSVGAILAPPVVAWILLTWGWPAAFLSIGILGFIWLLIWWPVYHTPRAVVQEAAPARVSTWTLFRTRFVWSFTLSKVFFDPVWYFYIFWFPEYLKNARHFDMASIGRYGWIPYAVAGLGNLFGGALSALLLRQGCSLTVARKGAATVFLCLMLSAIPAVLMADVRLSIVFVS